MTKTHGWAPVGDRLIDHTPAGRWNTQTFIVGMRHDDIVTLNNLPARRNTAAADILREIDAKFLFLPPYSPEPRQGSTRSGRL